MKISIRIASLLAEVSAQDLINVKQVYYPLDCDVWCCYSETMKMNDRNYRLGKDCAITYFDEIHQFNIMKK
jgi:hypothetical protein